MYLINNQQYVDVEPYIDFNEFKALDMHIAVGFAKTIAMRQEAGVAFANQYDQTFKSIQNESKDLENPDGKYYYYFRELNFDRNKCRTFLKYTGECIQMGQILQLRTYDGDQIQFKGVADECYDTRAAQHFKPLMYWINKLDAFDTIGRVAFFFNAPGEPHAVHKDYYTGSPDEYILFNLHLDRKHLFILDDEGNKTFVKSRAFIFDPRNYHGTIGGDFYSWTLRIDGRFNDEWLDKVGVKSYYRK